MEDSTINISKNHMEQGAEDKLRETQDMEGMVRLTSRESVMFKFHPHLFSETRNSAVSLTIYTPERMSSNSFTLVCSLSLDTSLPSSKLW
jgi:hypothetical protein